MTGRYFSLGPVASEVADEYIHHYYGSDFFDAARADTLTSVDQIHDELQRLSRAGCTDVVLFPCSGDLEQVSLLDQVALPASRVSSPDHHVVSEEHLAQA